MVDLEIPEDVPEERLYSTTELAKLWSVSASYVTQARTAGLLGFIDMATKGQRCQPRYSLTHVRAFVEGRDHAARLSA